MFNSYILALAQTITAMMAVPMVSCLTVMMTMVRDADGAR